MKKANLLSRAEMKKVMGGAEEAGRCVQCYCYNGYASVCYYSKRTGTALCSAVCHTSDPDLYDYTENVNCTENACFMN